MNAFLSAVLIAKLLFRYLDKLNHVFFPHHVFGVIFYLYDSASSLYIFTCLGNSDIRYGIHDSSSGVWYQ